MGSAPIRTRRGTFLLLSGVVLGILALGMALPFVVADPIRDVSSGRLGGPTDGTVIPTPGATSGPAGGPTPTTPTGVGPGGTGIGGPGSTLPPGTKLTASDRGVTATTIDVGVLVPDVGGLSAINVNVNAGDVQEQFQVYFDRVNAAGGIFGRRIRPVFRKYDLLDESDRNSACIYMTQVKKVFAVFDGGVFLGPPLLCIAQQNRTPLIRPASVPDEYEAAARGYLITIGAGLQRFDRSFAWELHQSGALKGKTIGVFGDTYADSKPGIDAFVSTLEHLGYTITHRTELAVDPGTQNAEIPVEVSRMHRQGVNVVLIVTGTTQGLSFVQNAEAQRWTPAYYVSDHQFAAYDAYAANFPRSFDGAIGFTQLRTGEAGAGLPEPAVDAHCRATYNKDTGNSVARGTTEDQLLMWSCSMVELFEAAAIRAGPTLTRDRLIGGFQSLGPVTIANTGGSSFGPGKLGAMDAIRTVRWSFGCKCYTHVTSFRALHY
jgi:ABC-type branched-subunit amino acid transport system substrate-binding protein